MRKKGEKRKPPNMADFGQNRSAVAGKSPLWEKLIHRLNNAAGPYEMVAGSLTDAIIYDCNKSKAWYSEDLPEDMVHERYADYPRITWSYYYGSTFRLHEKGLLCSMRSGRAAMLGTFIHPVLQYYPPGVMPLSPKRPWDKQMGIAMSRNTNDHPSAFWEATPGVSRVHLPDQFVWTDWEDIETLGMLDIFMEYVEHAAGLFCKGKSNGKVARKFDEAADVELFLGPDFIKNLEAKSNGCWEKSETMIGRV
jgi:hypothetical protein